MVLQIAAGIIIAAAVLQVLRSGFEIVTNEDLRILGSTAWGWWLLAGGGIAACIVIYVALQ